MKTVLMTAAAAFLLAGAAVQAAPAGSDRLLNAQQEATTASTSPGVQQLSPAGSRGIPSYELRQDGLLRSGLLPAKRWEG